VFGFFKTAGESFTKQTWCLSEEVTAIFQATARIFVQTAKFPPVISRKLLLAKILFSVPLFK